MSVTFKSLLTLRSFNEALSKSDGASDLMPITLLSRLVKKFAPFYEEFEEAVEDLKLDHCYKEGQKIVRDDKGQYQWTAEGEKAFRKSYKELINKEVSDLPDFMPLSYEALCESMPDGFGTANPWDVMSEVLVPFYCKD
jgi:hypothetical protein